MKRLKKVLFYIVFITFIVNCTSVSANPNHSFKHFNINNGLSQNTVHCILQDTKGFMWFGTKDGLNRFDGTAFKIFKFSSHGDLRDNVFHHIIEDKNGNIWVATEGGIYIYDHRKEKFERFAPEKNEIVDGWVSDMIQDPDGDIWISIEEKGVFSYNIESDSLAFFPVLSLPDGMRMISLCAGKNKDIWVFPYGLPMLRIDKKSGQISEFQLNDDPYFLNQLGEVRNILADDNDRLIIPTSNRGLVSINTKNKTHHVLLDSDASGNPIFVRTVKRIDNQTLWVGAETGVYILNTLDGTVVNLRHDHLMPTSLSDNAIYSIHKDREGGIWVGSYFGGVDYYSELLNKFELFYPIPNLNNMKGCRVRELCPTKEGKLWIGTEDNGLHLYDPSSNAFQPLPNKLQSLYTNIHALCEDGNYLWISTFSEGLNRFNLTNGELVVYTNSSDTSSISQNSAFAICKDRRGVLWIGTLAGLNVYDYSKDNFTRISEMKGIAIQDITEDSHGRIWISTFSNGLYRFNYQTNEWKIFLNDPDDPKSLPYNKVASVHEDGSGQLWIATLGGGFCLFDSKTDTFTTLNNLDGLPNNVVYQIVDDDAKNLWMSTNSGLACYNPQTGKFRNYTVENGLKTNQFNYKSSYKAPDGTIYFGSIDGFVRFNPSKFSEPEFAPSIVLTELFINNEQIVPAENGSPITQSILYTDRLDLPYDRNSLSLRYAVLNYSSSYTDRVFYRMEGVDQKWIQAADQQTIVYSNLNPGHYELLLALAGNDNEPFKIERRLLIHIRPPFWLNGWAYTLYFLLLSSIIYLLARFIILRNRQREQERMRDFEQQKERELYRSKIDFFTQVAHEIRTPISLIKAPLDHVIMTEQVSENVKDNLQIMSRNTDRLLNLTNQLLDFRKTESEKYSLNLRNINVSELIRETFLRFIPLAKQRKLAFELDLPEMDLFVNVDKEAFIKIVSNLLNNAVKYCESCVKVKAFIAADDGGQNLLFHLITENDGEKIPEKHKEEIFKPFVQLDREKERKIVGTGIGLALSKSLAELHKGELILETGEESEWIRFHLTLPAGDMEDAMPELMKMVEKDGDKEKGAGKRKEKGKKTNVATLLLVDDDLELLHFEEKFLSPHYNVLTAENGIQALEILREESVNLIVSDIMMPEMDGMELTARVKSDIEFSHIPVILLTAKVNVEAKVQGYETGADGYIDKPFSLEVLMARIANLLGNREKLRETFLENPFIGAASIVHNKSDEEFVKKLYAIVHEKLDNSEFIVEDIAEQFNMSRASFYRKIKGVLDLTPNEYIRVERLKKAAQLLREKNYKVNEICYMVGFSSPSYFSKCFQQQFGALPKDFK